MKWIIFYQTPYNTVRYLTDEMQEETSLSYMKFHEWIFSYKIINSEKLNERLNCFNTICLDMSSLEWEVVEPEKIKYDFETLRKFNPDSEEVKKEIPNSTRESKCRDYMNSVYDWRRANDRFNKYR